MELKMVVDACGRDGSDARDCNFPPLLDWDDVMRDERDDPWDSPAEQHWRC